MNYICYRIPKYELSSVRAHSKFRVNSHWWAREFALLKPKSQLLMPTAKRQNTSPQWQGVEFLGLFRELLMWGKKNCEYVVNVLYVVTCIRYNIVYVHSLFFSINVPLLFCWRARIQEYYNADVTTIMGHR